eukprot:gnl/TRDRNA2_/TRDRNA2_74788_c1_seq1.p1 gnl/TRDRNA2_/TRDRNA2_74788_c1~~gnl/TRDRNA2_/TRDRNA2_74788_c1_seq1.p1  ORF type:complete len:304 (-),score=44.17 gnl/TRDRNA2_/TRDRNA2_74788_c1_seq1:56-967(-)
MKDDSGSKSILEDVPSGEKNQKVQEPQLHPSDTLRAPKKRSPSRTSGICSSASMDRKDPVDATDARQLSKPEPEHSNDNGDHDGIVNTAVGSLEDSRAQRQNTDEACQSDDAKTSVALEAVVDLICGELQNDQRLKPWFVRADLASLRSQLSSFLSTNLSNMSPASVDMCCRELTDALVSALRGPLPLGEDFLGAAASKAFRVLQVPPCTDALAIQSHECKVLDMDSSAYLEVLPCAWSPPDTEDDEAPSIGAGPDDETGPRGTGRTSIVPPRAGIQSKVSCLDVRLVADCSCTSRKVPAKGH